MAPYIFKAKNGYVLDGIPKNVGEARYLKYWMETGKLHLDLVVMLEVSKVKVFERIGERDNSGRLETAAHYETRFSQWEAQKDNIFETMAGFATQAVKINTDELTLKQVADRLRGTITMHEDFDTLGL